MPNSAALVLISVFFVTCGILWAIAFFQLRLVTHQTIRVPGEVTGFLSYRSRGRVMYCAQYQAALPDGRTVRGESSMSKSWQSPPVGTKLALRYKEVGDKHLLAETGFLPLLVPTILFVIGAGLAVPGIVILVQVLGRKQ